MRDAQIDDVPLQREVRLIDDGVISAGAAIVTSSGSGPAAYTTRRTT
jgi:hypothetical protein